jgi:hypothetical protein
VFDSKGLSQLAGGAISGGNFGSLSRPAASPAAGRDSDHASKVLGLAAGPGWLGLSVCFDPAAVLPRWVHGKVTHWFLCAVGEPTDAYAVCGEPPEMGRAHKLAALYFAYTGQMAPVMGAAGLAHVRHACHVAPDDKVVIAERNGNDAPDRYIG